MKQRYTTNKEELRAMLKSLKLSNVSIRSTKLYGGGYWLRRKGVGGLPIWIRKSDAGNKRLLKQHLENVF